MQIAFTGKFTSAAGAIETITLGCAPSYVEVNNVTTNVQYRYFNDGTNVSNYSTNGADGVVTNSGSTIVKTSDGFSIAAATLSTSDVVYYVAYRL